MTKRSILVIGLGRFGVSTATTLANLGHEVVVVDQREEYINAVKDTVLHAMAGGHHGRARPGAPGRAQL